MTVYRQDRYRDPLLILLSDEARTCRGCIHAAKIRVVDETKTICFKGKRYGARCKSYDDGSDR